MRILPALFAILLLLLPSSLSAVMASQELSAQMETMASMSCCCEHNEAPVKPSGPVLSRSCCCDVDLPSTPSSQEEPIRIASSEKSETDFPANEACQLLPNAAILNSKDRCQPGAPRAPPRPLYLSFQSFLN